MDASRLSWMSGGGLTDAFGAADPPDERDDPVLRRIKAGVRAQLLGLEDVSVHIDRFVVLERIGAGAMGVVYAAYDPKLDRRVALKLLWSTDSRARAQILAEARALAQLSDPNVVTVHEIGEFEGRPYVAMECVQGRSLHAVLAQDQPRPDELLALFVEAGRGLAAAHAAGIVHRDFKPANVVVGDDGRVRVADFGLALDVEGGRTQPDHRAGTPAYMAPEQRAGTELSAATDQYSFCVAVIEALGAGVPRNAGDVRWSDATPVTTAIKEALTRGLAPDAKQRWPSMDALLEVLASDPTRRARRRLWWLTGGSVAALTGMTAVAWIGWSRSELTPCTSAADELAPVWSPARRDAIEAAWVGVGVVYGPAAWERVAPRLSEYGETWVREHTDACEATAVHGQQSPALLDLRMACLQQAKTELDAGLAVLEQADATVVASADLVLGGLPPLARCADLEALRRDPDAPSEAQAESVAQIRRLVAQSKALRLAGKLEEARPPLESARALMTAGSYEPVVAEVELERGRLLSALGEGPQAAAALRLALATGLRSGRDRAAIDAAAHLVYVRGVLQQRDEEAEAYWDVGRALAERGDDLRRQAGLQHHFAMVLEARGDYEKAQALGQQAIALESSGSYATRDLAAMRMSLGTILRGQGRYHEARAEFVAAMQIVEGLLGPDHPEAGNARTNLSSSLLMLEENDEAARQMRTGVEILERALGPEHPGVLRNRASLGGVLATVGEYDEAISMLRDVLRLCAMTPVDDDGATAIARGGLGLALLGSGRLEQAEAEFRAVVNLDEPRFGPRHPRLAQSHYSLGDVLNAQGRTVEGQAELRIAVDIGEEALGQDHPFVAAVRQDLALSLLGSDHLDEATALLRQAWETRQDPQIPAGDRGATAFALARALAQRKATWHEAGPLAATAAAAYREAGPAYADALAEVEAWISAH